MKHSNPPFRSDTSTADVALKNSAFIDPSLLPAVFHLGKGVFETFLARKKGSEATILGFDMHLSRILDGAYELSLASSTHAALTESVHTVLKTFNWIDTTEAILRIALLENDLIIRCSSWFPRLPLTGAHLIPYTAERSLPHLKSCSASISENAAHHAQANGGDEGLLLSESGLVREGAWSNLFFVDQKGTLHALTTCALPGITQQILLKLAAGTYSISFDEISLSTLLQTAREVFITNATHGIVPVIRIGETSFHIGPVTREFQFRYDAALSDPKYIHTFLL